jgi:hypothetical protein
VARAEANVRREAGFVQAARLSGNGDAASSSTQVLPNIMPIMMVQMSLTMGYAILNAAGLSFIGLGVRPPTPEWGIMVAEGAGFIVSGEWWIAFFPGLALMLAVFCFNLLGDGCATSSIRSGAPEGPDDPSAARRPRTSPSSSRPARHRHGRSRTGRHRVGKGETVGIVGESGSGKSVTSYAVMRILDRAGRIAAGSISFTGIDLSAMPESDRCATCAAARCR